MAKNRTAKLAERVDLIATGRTQGAAQGATARPLVADVDAWLALGWERVTQPESGADKK